MKAYTARETAQERAREIKVLLHLIGQTVEAETRQMERDDWPTAGTCGKALEELQELAAFLRCKPQN
jgi:hypothetical protein